MPLAKCAVSPSIATARVMISTRRPRDGVAHADTHHAPGFRCRAGAAVGAMSMMLRAVSALAPSLTT